MCLGGAAKAANENARRRYKYENERRERQWMQRTSIYAAQKVKYQEDVHNANLGKANVRVQQQEAMNVARADAQVKYAELFRTLQKDSAYGKLVASGQTGQSTRRRGTLDFAKYGRDVSEVARKLTLNDRELARKSSAAQAQLDSFKDEAFSKVAFQPIKDVAPPQPVMRNVGAEAFMQGLSIAGSLASGAGSLGWKPFDP